MPQTDLTTTRIGEHDYEMSMLSPMQSHNLLIDFVQMVGPALGPVFDMFYGAIKSGDKDFLDQEIAPEFFTKAASTLFSGLDKAVVERIILAFRKVTIVQGIGVLDNSFDAHFLGKIDEMYQWVAWGMRVQWGKAFSALVSGVTAQGAQMMAATKADPSQSPST